MKRTSLVILAVFMAALLSCACDGKPMATTAPRPAAANSKQRIQTPVEVPLEKRVEAVQNQCMRIARGYDPRAGGTSERPDFGFSNQVLSPDELVIGETYVWCDLLADIASPYVLLDVHPDPETGRPLAKMQLWGEKFLQNGKDYIVGPRPPRDFLLSELGVVPYSNGTWASTTVLLHLF